MVLYLAIVKMKNIVYFASTFNNKKTNNAAEEIKRVIEQYNLNTNKGTTIVKEEDKYDKLAKLKKTIRRWCYNKRRV